MQQEVRVDIGELMRFVRRGLIPALIIGGALAFLAVQYASRQDPVYESEATVLASQTNPVLREFELSTVTAPPLDVGAYQAAATSDPVLRTALQRMGISEPTQAEIRGLRSSLRVLAQDTASASLVSVVATGSTPSSAANRANAVANALVDWDRSRAADNVNQLVQRLEMQIENLTAQVRSLQTLDDPGVSDQITGLINRRAERQEQLAYARALSDSATALLTVLQPASPVNQPVAPRPVLYAMIAFVLGVAATYGFLLLRQAMNTKLTGLDDLAHSSGLPVLAEYPRFAWGDKNLLREASSYLRTNLLFATADEHPKVFLITSAQSGEGKTAIATSLAEGFVRNGYRTLLIDADLRSPSISKLYRIPSGRSRSSLVEWLKGPYESHQPVDVSLGTNQSLQVIPVFQAVSQPSELLSIGFRSCLEKWRQDYDAIVIDTAPVLAVADTLAIAPYATGTVLVSHMQKGDRRQVAAATDLLRRIGVRLLGVVATHTRHDQQRGYSYGYVGGQAGSKNGPYSGHEPQSPVQPASSTSRSSKSRTKRLS